MAIFPVTNAAKERRERIKNELWSDEIAWTGEGEKGWFRAPRTLPLVLALLSQKELSGSFDPGRVYLDLLARHRDSGIVDIALDEEHSFSSGYSGTPANRTSKERMNGLV